MKYFGSKLYFIIPQIYINFIDATHGSGMQEFAKWTVVGKQAFVQWTVVGNQEFVQWTVVARCGR